MQIAQLSSWYPGALSEIQLKTESGSGYVAGLSWAAKCETKRESRIGPEAKIFTGIMKVQGRKVNQRNLGKKKNNFEWVVQTEKATLEGKMARLLGIVSGFTYGLFLVLKTILKEKNKRRRLMPKQMGFYKSVSKFFVMYPFLQIARFYCNFT